MFKYLTGTIIIQMMIIILCFDTAHSVFGETE